MKNQTLECNLRSVKLQKTSQILKKLKDCSSNCFKIKGVYFPVSLVYKKLFPPKMLFFSSKNFLRTCCVWVWFLFLYSTSPPPPLEIHPASANVNLIVLNMAAAEQWVTPSHRFNSGNQGYEITSQNWRKLTRAVVWSIKICLGEEGLCPASFNLCTAVLIIRINDLDF